MASTGAGGPPPEPERRRAARATFRPRFTVMLLWLAALTVFYALLLAAPALVDAYRALPPAAGPELRAEERALAEETARRALGGGRIVWAFGAAAVTVGLGTWSRRLPGLR